MSHDDADPSLDELARRAAEGDRVPQLTMPERYVEVTTRAVQRAAA